MVFQSRFCPIMSWHVLYTKSTIVYKKILKHLFYIPKYYILIKIISFFCSINNLYLSWAICYLELHNGSVIHFPNYVVLHYVPHNIIHFRLHTPSFTYLSHPHFAFSLIALFSSWSVSCLWQCWVSWSASIVILHKLTLPRPFRVRGQDSINTETGRLAHQSYGIPWQLSWTPITPHPAGQNCIWHTSRFPTAFK